MPRSSIFARSSSCIRGRHQQRHLHHHHHAAAPFAPSLNLRLPLLLASPPASIARLSSGGSSSGSGILSTARLQRSSYSSSSSSSSSSSPQSAPPAGEEDEMAEEPTGLIATSGIELLTFGTPNGYKAAILLEELKEAYGLEYTWQSVNISKNTQKQPWFTAINPNGRIPAIVDHDKGGLAVFEGAAILDYLARTYDTDRRLSFDPEREPAEYATAASWIAWQHGGLGPMQGQANHFLRFAKERIPYATQRYVGETERLYGVLEARLAGTGAGGGGERDFVAGPGRGRYSIADMSMLGWASFAVFSGVDLPGMFPHVDAWVRRCVARPATERGLAVPGGASALRNDVFLARIAEDAELREKEEAVRKFLADAKEQYGYKYASP